MSDIPDYLYHYTSIETLALILATKRIRFTRLDLVNDPEEGLSQDLPGIKFWVFVSCWTSEEEERIPLWKLYTPDMKGCRIRLPITLFDGHSEGPRSGTGHTKLREPVEYEAYCDDDSHDILLGPSRIRYTKDEKQLKPSLTKDNGKSIGYDASPVGLVKRSHWRVEEEVRYRIHLALNSLDDFGLYPGENYPYSDAINSCKWPELGSEMEDQYARDAALQDWYAKYPFSDLVECRPKNEWLDVPIRKEVLKDLIITLGPEAEEAEWVIVEALKKRFAPSATITESHFRVR